jgi:hypothetical protein
MTLEQNRIACAVARWRGLIDESMVSIDDETPAAFLNRIIRRQVEARRPQPAAPPRAAAPAGT